MTDRNTMHKKTYHSRGCDLHLCYSVAQGYYLQDPRAYGRQVGEPRFRCEHCGRRAQRRANLCVPQPIKESPR
jgi:hypothetical protein